MPRRGGRKTLLPAAGERPAIFLGIGLFPLAFWFTEQSIGFCPLLPPPLVSELMGGSAPALLCYRQTAKCHRGERSAESRTVSTTQRAGRVGKLCTDLTVPRHPVPTCQQPLPMPFLSPQRFWQQKLFLGLSPSRTCIHIHAFHRITSQPAIALSHPHKAGKYY